jgi:hypothetical protein
VYWNSLAAFILYAGCNFIYKVSNLYLYLYLVLKQGLICWSVLGLGCILFRGPNLCFFSSTARVSLFSLSHACYSLLPDMALRLTRLLPVSESAAPQPPSPPMLAMLAPAAGHAAASYLSAPPHLAHPLRCHRWLSWFAAWFIVAAPQVSNSLRALASTSSRSMACLLAFLMDFD